jgi:uncharacterized membrane protein YfcA
VDVEAGVRPRENALGPFRAQQLLADKHRQDLAGWKLAVAVVVSFVFGALQTIGVGFYAPCMATVFALGMHPKTAFPIMMTATAMLMAAGSARFVKEKAYDPKAAVALTLAGIFGVFLAAFVVKSLPLTVMK